MGLSLMAMGLAAFSPLAIRILSKDYHEATAVVTLLVFALMVASIPLTSIMSQAELGRAKQLIRDKFRARANRNHTRPNEQDHDA